MASLFPHAQATFKPPQSGIGPNRYASNTLLWAMVGVAFFVHIAFFVIAELLPTTEIKQVPVRALNLKLGDAQTGLGVRMVPRLEPAQQPAMLTPKPAPVAQPTPEPAPAPVAEPEPKRVSITEALQKQPPKENPAPRKTPAEQSKPLAELGTKAVSQSSIKVYDEPEKAVEYKPVGEPAPMPKVVDAGKAVPVTPVASVDLPAPAAIAATPQQYVREQQVAPAHAGLAEELSGQNAPNTDQEILKRYEQVLSLWVNKHLIYPDQAKLQSLSGQAVVRIVIDRNGRVLSTTLEKPTQHTILNMAAMEMVKRANPVPSVPGNYPNKRLSLEFLIPINFKP